MPPVGTNKIIGTMFEADYKKSLHFYGDVVKEMTLMFEGNACEVAAVGRLMCFKDGKLCTLALRNIQRKVVKRIKKEVQNRPNTFLNFVNKRHTTKFPLSETIEGPPSEKIKLVDYLRVKRLFEEGVFKDTHKFFLYVVISAYLRGLKEEMPAIFGRNIAFQQIRFHQNSYFRSDKILVLFDLLVDPLDLEIDQDVQISDDIEVSIQDDEVELSWSLSELEYLEVPKEVTARLVPLAKLDRLVLEANADNDKGEVLTQNWAEETLPWYVSQEDIYIILNDIYQNPFVYGGLDGDYVDSSADNSYRKHLLDNLKPLEV